MRGRTSFAFGAVLYEMVAGKRAFDRGTDADTIAAVLATPPRSMSSPLEIPAAFHHVIERCLARNPDERWQTAHNLKVELEWLVKAEPSPASSRLVPTRRQKQLAAVAAVVLAAGAAAWSLWPRLRSPVNPLLTSDIPKSRRSGMWCTPPSRRMDGPSRS